MSGAEQFKAAVPERSVPTDWRGGLERMRRKAGQGRGACVVAHKFRYCVCAKRAENATCGTDLRELMSTVGATQR
jgi:hypothetical protein